MIFEFCCWPVLPVSAPVSVRQGLLVLHTHLHETKISEMEKAR